MYIEKILKDEKGVTVVLGALLILGIAAIAIPPWYNYYVDSTMEDQEIKHMDSVESSFRNIQDQISWMNEGGSGTVNIKLNAGSIRYFSGSSPAGRLEFKSGSDYGSIIDDTDSFRLTWDTENDWLEASITEKIRIDGTEFHLYAPIETAENEDNGNYTFSENNGFWEDHRVATGVNVDGMSSMNLIFDYSLGGENNEEKENITLDNYLGNSGGSSNGEGTVLYYENAANVEGLDWMDIRCNYAIEYGHPQWSVNKPENLTGGSWLGEYSSIENLDETQENYLVLFKENTEVIENQVLQNGDFIDDKEPWTIDRVETGENTRWTIDEQYVRGGSIESWAANGNTEEAYVTQTFDGFTSDDIVGDLTFSGAYMINVVNRSPDVATITYQIRDGGTWQDLFSYSGEDGTWISENTTYTPTGTVDAVRAHITLTAKNDAGPNVSDVYAYVDNISLTGSFEKEGKLREDGYRISESYQTGIENVENSEISWVDNEPTGTNVSIYTAVTDTNTAPTLNSSEWIEATNATPFVNKNDNLAGKYLWFKQELSTTIDNTPQLMSLDASINGENVEGEVRFEVNGEERVTWSADTGGSFVTRENSVDVSGSDQVTVAFYMDAGNRTLENALVEIDWAQHEYVKEFSGEADENRAGVRILVDGVEVFNDNAIGPVTNTFDGSADVSGEETVDVQFQYWTEDNSEVNIFKTSYEYVDNADMGYAENGYLETDVRTVEDNGQPNLRGLSYNLNGENIKLEVIGSPDSVDKEIIYQELTGESEYELGWTDNHDNFKIRIILETGDNQITPVFDSVSLEKVDESKTTSYSEVYYYLEGEYEELWREGYSNESFLQSKEDDHLYLATTSTPSETSWVTKDPVDLKEVENLVVDWKNTGQTNGKSYLIVTENKFENREVYERRLVKSGSFNRENNFLDVSELDNEYYLRIHAVENQSVNSASELSTYRIRGTGSIENIPSHFIPEIKELNISLYPGHLQFSGTNYHFPNQDFIYESNQLILNQKEGHLILSKGGIFKLNEEEKTIEVEYPKLIGENIRISSSGTESLNFQFEKRKKETWTVENTFQLTIETDYESGWEKYLQGEVDKIEEKFEISNSSIEIGDGKVTLIIESNEKIKYSIVDKIIRVQ